MLAAGTEARADALLLGVWVGAVTAATATVRVLARAGTVVQLQVVAAGQMPLVRTAGAADGVATFTLDSLAPACVYDYTITTGDERLQGRFRTFGRGPFAFRAVFASCAQTGSTSPVFAAMRELAPDVFFHMGDLHYEDITRNEVAVFGQAFARVHASPAQSALFRSTSVAYVWDDHDFGANNSARSSPSRAAALAAYRRFVPHYPLTGGPDAPIHQSFDIGRVRVLMLDVRSQRVHTFLNRPERTMLGHDQLSWLERELDAAANAALVILVNPVPWIGRPGRFIRHGWSAFPEERARVADAVVRAGLTDRLLMLSGDAHMLALDDGTHSQYSTRADAPRRGFVVAHAAPLDREASRKGGPYSHGPVLGNGQFGVLDVQDDGQRLRWRIELRQGEQAVPGLTLDGGA